MTYRKEALAGLLASLAGDLGWLERAVSGLLGSAAKILGLASRRGSRRSRRRSPTALPRELRALLASWNPPPAERMDPLETDESERRWIREVTRNAPDAVERFLRRVSCVPLILNALNVRSGAILGRAELEDLCQDVLVQVWRRLDSFNGLSPFEAWVYRFCSYTFLNAVRRKRRRGPVASLDVDPASRSSDLEQHFRFEHLYQSLDRLDAEEARVVSLKHFQNMTFEEISARTQISENTLKTRYYRGLRKLRHFLTRQDEEELP